MPAKIKAHNRHPVDRLHEVREAIKALEAEAKTLRDDILDSGDVIGDDHVAMVKDTVRKLLDRPALEKRFGATAVAECCKESSVTTLTIYAKANLDVFS